jgi:hypothetical protein
MVTDALFDGDADGYRAEYLYAVEVARALHDPATDWEGFRDVLWQHLMRVFGVDDLAAWPSALPSPDEGPGGDAREVAAWLREVGESGQRSGPRD